MRAMPDTNPDLRGRVFDFANVARDADMMRVLRKGVFTI
jgi:hypothetical protein